MRIPKIVLSILTLCLSGCVVYDVGGRDVSVVHHGDLRYTVFATTTDRYESLKLAKGRAEQVCHAHNRTPHYINIKTNPKAQDNWEPKRKPDRDASYKERPKRQDKPYQENRQRTKTLNRVLVDFRCTYAKPNHSHS